MPSAITWPNADPDLCRHMASLGSNERPTPDTNKHRLFMSSMPLKTAHSNQVLYGRKSLVMWRRHLRRLAQSWYSLLNIIREYLSSTKRYSLFSFSKNKVIYWNLITYSFSNFNKTAGHLTHGWIITPTSLLLWHGWKIISHSFMWTCLTNRCL